MSALVVEDTMRAALYRRSMSGHIDWLTVGSLVQSHAAVAASVHAPCKRTGLHVAVSENKADYVRLLVARGADVSAKCGLGLTPLLLAVVRGHAASADALLELGAGGSREELAACVCIGRYLGHARIVDALLGTPRGAMLGDDVAALPQSPPPPPPPPPPAQPLSHSQTDETVPSA
jgi:uncharacterized protein